MKEFISLTKKETINKYWKELGNRKNKEMLFVGEKEKIARKMKITVIKNEEGAQFSLYDSKGKAYYGVFIDNAALKEAIKEHILTGESLLLDVAYDELLNATSKYYNCGKESK